MPCSIPPSQESEVAGILPLLKLPTALYSSPPLYVPPYPLSSERTNLPSTSPPPPLPPVCSLHFHTCLNLPSIWPLSLLSPLILYRLVIRHSSAFCDGMPSCHTILVAYRHQVVSQGLCSSFCTHIYLQPWHGMEMPEPSLQSCQTPPPSFLPPSFPPSPLPSPPPPSLPSGAVDLYGGVRGVPSGTGSATLLCVARSWARE